MKRNKGRHCRHATYRCVTRRLTLLPDESHNLKDNIDNFPDQSALKGYKIPKIKPRIQSIIVVPTTYTSNLSGNITSPVSKGKFHSSKHQPRSAHNGRYSPRNSRSYLQRPSPKSQTCSVEIQTDFNIPNFASEGARSVEQDTQTDITTFCQKETGTQTSGKKVTRTSHRPHKCKYCGSRTAHSAAECRIVQTFTGPINRTNQPSALTATSSDDLEAMFEDISDIDPYITAKLLPDFPDGELPDLGLMDIDSDTDNLDLHISEQDRDLLDTLEF